MGCNSVTKFYYSDDVFICNLYRQFDSHPENHIRRIIEIIEEDNLKNVQWDYLVYHILVEMRQECSRMRMVYETPNEDSTVIYSYEIKPVEHLFTRPDAPLAEGLNLKIFSSGETIYDGPITDFPVDKDEDENQLEKSTGIFVGLSSSVGPYYFYSQEDFEAIPYVRRWMELPHFKHFEVQLNDEESGQYSIKPIGYESTPIGFINQGINLLVYGRETNNR